MLFDPVNRIGKARMSKRVTSSFFIDNLNALSLRQPHSTAVKATPPITAALLNDIRMSAARDQLLKYVTLGERAHGFRDADALMRIGQGILSLPLGAKASSIGLYYTALSVNRRGLQAYPLANSLLEEVAETGPDVFRSKAMIALATNLNVAGNRDSAVSVFVDAAKALRTCGYGGLHSACILEIQQAFFHYADGDHRSALAILRKLSPALELISPQYPALLHVYYNNLAVQLCKTGEIEEARSFYSILSTSPYRRCYPEWATTIAELEASHRRPTRTIMCLAPSPARSNVSPFFLRCEPKELTKFDKFKARFWPKPRKGRLLQFESQQQRKDRFERIRQARALMRPAITPEEAYYMTMSQKQAFALRYVLNDDITEGELDEVIKISISRAPAKDPEKKPEG